MITENQRQRATLRKSSSFRDKTYPEGHEIQLCSREETNAYYQGYMEKRDEDVIGLDQMIKNGLLYVADFGDRLRLVNHKDFKLHDCVCGAYDSDTLAWYGDSCPRHPDVKKDMRP